MWDASTRFCQWKWSLIVHGEFTSPLFTSRRRHVFAVSCKGGDSLQGMFGQRSILRILATFEGSTVCHPFIRNEIRWETTLFFQKNRHYAFKNWRQRDKTLNIARYLEETEKLLENSCQTNISRDTYEFCLRFGPSFFPQTFPCIFHNTRRKERGNE